MFFFLLGQQLFCFEVVIALSGGEILYFEIDESHTLNEVRGWIVVH
jgi:hypothetical protein